nr:MAG TPA: hypothetical protein [Caudoviricetes sp.]
MENPPAFIKSVIVYKVFNYATILPCSKRLAFRILQSYIVLPIVFNISPLFLMLEIYIYFPHTFI